MSETNFYSSLYRLNELRKATAASTLDGAINNFLQALELTDTQSGLVSNRQQLVREKAAASNLFDVEKSQLIGSYARDTQIRSVKSTDFIDVDSFLILEGTERNLERYWRNKDGGYKILDDLKNALNGYQGLTAKVDRPAVTLSWSNMTMEMVPAFRRNGGGFLIPSQNWLDNEWQVSDPILDAERITQANKKCNGNFKPLVKMLKCWNRKNSKVLSSFGIETVLYHSTASSFQSFNFELSWFFKKLREFNGKSVESPSGLGKPISINLGFYEQIEIQAAENNIKKAFALASDGRHQEAIKIFGSVFGHPFQGT